MKSISKPRDTQNARDEKENELNEKVEEFFNDVVSISFDSDDFFTDVRTKAEKKVYEELAKGIGGRDALIPFRREFGKMITDLRNGKTGLKFTIDTFKVITEFYVYDETKEKILKIFCDFFKRLVDSKNLSKPIEVLKYENYLQGLELIKTAIDYDTDEYFYKKNSGKYKSETLFFKTHREFYTFKEKANLYFKEEEIIKLKEEYELKKSTQKIKDDFNTQLYALAELYQLPVSYNTYKHTLSNAIEKYLIPKPKKKTP
ncbi:hypothetical protein O6B72_08610 [Campylobacter ureolyticus]|uniref:hypothetical protein n=1 Tax=Campylobacter ureolyticus TaxID=827 RepID=UPI0022B33DB4|nr:hypothetical protein [Campylobacter ureolyticus]MCZ6156867.1 hypothetical protein [Campylobacter ureolyticus]